MRKMTTGKVLSELARRALEPPAVESETRNGVPVLPPRPGERHVSLEDVNRLRDGED